jgi:hypothetical protein
MNTIYTHRSLGVSYVATLLATLYLPNLVTAGQSNLFHFMYESAIHNTAQITSHCHTFVLPIDVHKNFNYMYYNKLTLYTVILLF